MTTPRPHPDTPALAEIRRAVQAVREEIAAQTDPEAAFWLAQAAAIVIREIADELARERALIAVDLTENGVSLAKLGHMIGVSKSRAGQVVEHGRRVRSGESPHVPN